MWRRRSPRDNARAVKAAPLCLLAAAALAARAARADDSPPAPAPLSLAVSATPDGAWSMALTNTSDRPQRVHADVRLLWFEVIGAPEAPPSDARRPPRARAFPRGKLPVCRVPAELRPLEGDRTRQVVLAPGERWEAPFDPVLLCGASKLGGELDAGALVYPSYGYPAPPPRPRWKQPPKDDDVERPFVAEAVGASPPRPVTLVEGPVAIVIARPVVAPSASGADASKPPASDDAATPTPGSAPEAPPAGERVSPVMKLTAPRRGDVVRGADVVVGVTLTYVGKRRTSAHVRGDDLEFDVVSPDGQRHACSRRAGVRGPVRDFFDTWRPGARRGFSTRVAEVCGGGVFDAPGVYTIRPTLVLHEAGEEYSLQSLVARATTDHAVHVRVRTGKLPFVDAPARPAGAQPPSSP